MEDYYSIMDEQDASNAEKMKVFNRIDKEMDAEVKRSELNRLDEEMCTLAREGSTIFRHDYK